MEMTVETPIPTTTAQLFLATRLPATALALTLALALALAPVTEAAEEALDSESPAAEPPAKEPQQRPKQLHQGAQIPQAPARDFRMDAQSI